jgi:hypothetical protein
MAAMRAVGHSNSETIEVNINDLITADLIN